MSVEKHDVINPESEGVIRFFCGKAITRQDYYSDEWVRKETSNDRKKVFMHNTCRLDNSDELQKLAA